MSLGGLGPGPFIHSLLSFTPELFNSPGFLACPGSPTLPWPENSLHPHAEELCARGFPGDQAYSGPGSELGSVHLLRPHPFLAPASPTTTELISHWVCTSTCTSGGPPLLLNPDPESPLFIKNEREASIVEGWTGVYLWGQDGSRWKGGLVPCTKRLGSGLLPPLPQQAKCLGFPGLTEH